MTTSSATTGSGAAGIPVPARRRGYVLTAAVMVVMMLGGTLPIPLYVIYQKQMGFGTLGVTVVFAAYVAGTLFALVALGDLSDHVGRRKVLAIGAACATVSTVLFLVSAGIGLLVTARVVSGLAAGFITGTATAALAELQPRGDRRAAAVVASGSNQAGLGLGPLIGGVFAEYVALPTRSVFWTYLGVCALALAALAAAVVSTFFAAAYLGLGLPPVLTGLLGQLVSAVDATACTSALTAVLVLVSFVVVLRTFNVEPAAAPLGTPGDSWCCPEETATAEDARMSASGRPRQDAGAVIRPKRGRSGRT